MPTAMQLQVGRDTQDAAKMAIEDINASGMLGGNTLNMPPELVIDYHCWPEGAAEKARSLLKQNIVALTGVD